MSYIFISNVFLHFWIACTDYIFNCTVVNFASLSAILKLPLQILDRWMFLHSHTVTTINETNKAKERREGMTAPTTTDDVKLSADPEITIKLF